LVTEATVTAVEGKYAVVENERKSACEGCHKNVDGNPCSICSLAGGNRKISMSAYNKIGAEVGDRVEVETESRRVLWYAALIFILPIVIALVGYYIGNAVSDGDKLGLLLAVAGMVLAFAGVAIYSKLVVGKRNDAVIVRIIKKSNICDI